MMKNLIDKPLKLLIGKGVVEFTQGFGQSAVVDILLPQLQSHHGNDAPRMAQQPVKSIAILYQKTIISMI